MAQHNLNTPVSGLPYFTPQHLHSLGTPMELSSSTPTLFRALQIRNVTLRNRIIVSPLCQYSSASSVPNIGALTDWHTATLGHYAIKGAALVFVGATAVQLNGRISTNCPGISSIIVKLADKLVSFLSYSDPTVKQTANAQPYAALAWSGVSLIIPLLLSDVTQNAEMLEGFAWIIDLQIFWEFWERKNLTSEYGENYQSLVESLIRLCSYIIEYQTPQLSEIKRLRTVEEGILQYKKENRQDEKERDLLRDLVEVAVSEGHLRPPTTTITLTPSAVISDLEPVIAYFFFNEGGGGKDANGKLLTVELPVLWQILMNCATGPGTNEITCVLDALDECEQNSREWILHNLVSFYHDEDMSSKSKLKILFTSRPYQDLEHSFKNFNGNAAYMRLDGDETSEQIRQEIDLVIDADVDKFTEGFDDDNVQKIKTSLKSMENRIYLWLHLTLDIIH
ncbi:hypothetical protein UA08_02515 [Talaromyces atroroseus]|uniref:NWD NACHT-NTPase N-terminal domain-containing protein n=1 Tax=Talaromyces atroroseus TaxID=1441469 RepID=A0A225AVC5_TALAT|nr:hypothetical protein UA08_02515 [Talaromyces atroroseus]OKL62324.1 hypothetical protein UA08_02515 [Talaromyces atroroseus]